MKAIVEKAGGEVVVVSDGPGRGSTFCFSIKAPVYNEESYQNIQIES